jgi:hypothetical protein
MKKTRKYILGFATHNEEMCKLKIKGKYNDITLINVHAPTLDKTNEDKEQFYEDIRSYKKGNIVITLRDLNSKFGKERI